MRETSRNGGMLVLGLLACGCSSSSPAKAEAAALSRAVTSLREADNGKKPELLATLRGAECSQPDVCSVRSQCLAAYELHVDVLARLGSVMSKADAQAGDLGAVETLKQDLERSRKLVGACTDAQGEMIRRYKL